MTGRFRVLADGGERLRRSDLVTLGLTFAVVGVTVAALVVTEDTEPWVAILAAGVVFSATAELAFVAVVAGGGSTAAGVLSGWLVSTRFGLLSITLARALGPGLPARWRALAAFVVIDPNAAVAAAEPGPGDARRSYGVLSFWMAAGYLVGSVAGALLGSRIGDPATVGLDAVFPAVLVAVSAPAWRRREGLVAATIGFAVTLATVELTPGGVPVLLSLTGAVLAVALVRPPSGTGAGSP